MAALVQSSEEVVAAGEPRARAAKSLLSAAPTLVILAIAVADCGRVADTDLWGHLVFGRMLWHQGPHLGPDPFSYAPHYAHWLHHEWLSEVLMARIYASSGVVGLKLWKLACTAVTIGLIATAEGESEGSIGLQFAILIVAAFAMVPFVQFRPLILSYAFTAATVALITRDNYGKRSPLWLFIPGLALWSNLHGSFFIGLTLLGTYTVVRGFTDLIACGSARRLVRLSAITLGSAVASLATPYGIDSWRAVFISLRNPMTREVMADWRPLLTVLGEQMRETHGGSVFLLCAVGVFALFTIVTLLTLCADDLALVAIAALLSISALMAVRNVPLALVAVTPVLVRHLRLLFQDGIGWRAQAQATTTEPTHPGWFVQMVFGGLAVIILARTGLIGSRMTTAKNYPDGAVAFMQEHHLRGNILNNFAWGQYLIWHSSKDSKIFIDGRFDLVYPPELIREYMAFFDAKLGSARTLDRYPHDFVLLPPQSAANQTMASRHDWKLVYQDSTARLYTRASSPLPAIQAETNTASGAGIPNIFP
ncbi:MAG TPA: hypothetical protein VMT61_10970 [Candidatus Binataceae bacterium]|nr:hypothetical protein [Candidatus Binataceae bacterium]